VFVCVLKHWQESGHTTPKGLLWHKKTRKTKQTNKQTSKQTDKQTKRKLKPLSSGILALSNHKASPSAPVSGILLLVKPTLVLSSQRIPTSSSSPRIPLSFCVFWVPYLTPSKRPRTAPLPFLLPIRQWITVLARWFSGSEPFLLLCKSLSHFQNPGGVSQGSVTPGPEHPMPSSDLTCTKSRTWVHSPYMRAKCSYIWSKINLKEKNNKGPPNSSLLLSQTFILFKKKKLPRLLCK